MARKFMFFGPYITTPNARAPPSRAPGGSEEPPGPGVYKLGGPFFADNGAAERAYGGSFFLMEAESYADALEVVQADVYYKEGLWDVSNVRLVEYAPLMGYPF